MGPNDANGCPPVRVWTIPSTYADRKALRDYLNAFVDVPGADPAPIPCATGTNPRKVAASTRRVHDGGAYLRIEGDRGADIALTPDDARRLAARLVFLVDNPGAV